MEPFKDNEDFKGAVRTAKTAKPGKNGKKGLFKGDSRGFFKVMGEM